MLTTGVRWRGARCSLAHFARPPPWLLGFVCVEREGLLMRRTPPVPRGGRVVPLAASGVVQARGPIPLPSTFIVPRSGSSLTIKPFTL